MEVSLLRLPPPSFYLNEHQENKKKYKENSVRFVAEVLLHVQHFPCPHILMKSPIIEEQRRRFMTPLVFLGGRYRGE